ncbi:MAG: hypothetical protein NXH95_13710 [Pseudomonadaceae bacterium]|nr:hypothetical protein [Pseudomonadaceae bacterium]
MNNSTKRRVGIKPLFTLITDGVELVVSDYARLVDPDDEKRLDIGLQTILFVFTFFKKNVNKLDLTGRMQKPSGVNLSGTGIGRFYL